MSRPLTLLLCVFALVAGCSRNPERISTASPTSPTTQSAAQPGSLLGSTSVAPGGVSGKFDVSFPGRNDSFDFRNQLETKYQTLGRAAAPSSVDLEGEVVWTQEYIRYRVNGCDHATAVQRVLAQINGQPAGQVCGAAPGEVIAFPPRTDTLDFRRQLESRYEQFGRGFSLSTVDVEGSVIWPQEYLRYRVNQCDHPTSVQKVFSQIDGGGVAATCSCAFTVSPATQAVTASGGTFTATVTRTAGTCSFGTEANDPFVSVTGGGSGSAATTTLAYTVLPNFGAARTTWIRVRWLNNSTVLDINQDSGIPTAITMTDPNTAIGPTTTCLIKTTLTPCVFVATGNFSPNAIYAWHVDYQYGSRISHDFSSTDPRFFFTEMCGGPGAAATGIQVPMNVIVVVTDGDRKVTIQPGVSDRVPLSIRFFTC